MLQIKYLAAALLLTSACGDDTTAKQYDDTCAAPDPWEAAVEDWATAERGNLTRHGRIMSLPPSQGYYVTDRVDLVPPPPPPHYPPHSQVQRRGPYPAAGHHAGPPSYQQSGPQGYGPPSTQNYAPSPGDPNQGPPPGGPNQGPSLSGQNQGPPPGGPNHRSPPDGPNQGPPPGGPNHGPPFEGPNHGPPPGGPNQGPPLGYSGSQGSMPYDEWQATPPPPPGAGKIVNRPPNPYKDQFKPSYPPPNRPIPVESADRVDTAPPPPPQKQVSETDLYLLRAIEKLVYRMDLMEKRMRKMEESMHYIVAGAEAKPEPCPSNFTRIGPNCYHISAEATNWKSASYACRKLKANLLELDEDEKRTFTSGLQDNPRLKGLDLWTGGLNPGLLWIWSHSAKPVSGNSSAPGSSGVAGEGRCLALVASPAAADYAYRGQDCALRHRYVCERDEDKEKLSNEIERVAKSLKEKRKPKIAWDRR